MKTILGSLTVGILSTGDNLSQLAVTLGSILCGSHLPRNIIIQFNNPTRRLDDFCLSQLAHLSTIFSVDLSTFVVSTLPAYAHIRHYRDSLISRCQSPYLLFIDDDVLVDHDGIGLLFEVMSCRVKDGQTRPGFVCGSKCDVSDIRRYPDFTKRFQPLALNPDTHTPYFDHPERLFSCHLADMDSGFVVLCLPNLSEKGITFSTSDHHANALGEDSVFGKRVIEEGLSGWFVPNARAWHLEKPSVRFTESESRKEIVLRTLETIKLRS